MSMFFLGALFGSILGIAGFFPWLYVMAALLGVLEATGAPDSVRALIIVALYSIYGVGNIFLAFRTKQTLFFGFLFAIPIAPMLIMTFMITFVTE